MRIAKKLLLKRQHHFSSQYYCKARKTQSQKELLSMICNAQKLHGHLGPFLVLGVRMGMIARKALNVADDKRTSLRANVKVPLSPPFSCLLDGIQASTSCTVGNQRLTMENSEVICVSFAKQNGAETVKITLKPKIAEELKKKISECALTEKFALELADMPENQLFNVEIE
jgi:formylmethanofuran dehydrogenase subunit E